MLDFDEFGGGVGLSDVVGAGRGARRAPVTERADSRPPLHGYPECPRQEDGHLSSSDGGFGAVAFRGGRIS